MNETKPLVWIAAAEVAIVVKIRARLAGTESHGVALLPALTLISMPGIPPGGMWAKVNCYTQTGREQTTTQPLKRQQNACLRGSRSHPVLTVSRHSSDSLPCPSLLRIESQHCMFMKYPEKKKACTLPHAKAGGIKLVLSTDCLWNTNDAGNAAQRGKDWSVSSRPGAPAARCEISHALMSPLRKSIHPR